MVSSKPEVEWDDVELAWMSALEAHEADVLCPLCGIPKEICRAYDTDGNVDIEFERCHVTAALGRKQRANHDSKMEIPESLAYSVSIKGR